MELANSETRNEFYRVINVRFDERAEQLAKIGFVYRVLVPGVAVFTRTRYGREINISAGTVLHAEVIAWNDEFARVQ